MMCFSLAPSLRLSAGQMAMARAMLSPSRKPGRPKKGEKRPANLPDASVRCTRKARAVLYYDEALARSVMSGAVTLNAAYQLIRGRPSNQTAKSYAEAAQ